MGNFDFDTASVLMDYIQRLTKMVIDESPDSPRECDCLEQLRQVNALLHALQLVEAELCELLHEGDKAQMQRRKEATA